MKTKITLFVTVLVAALFGMGCAVTVEFPGGGKQQANSEQPEQTVKPTEPAFVKDGLVAYYPFNGNAKDESGNGFDGEMKGGVFANDRHGKAKAAYSTDKGVGFIDLGNRPEFNFGNEDFALSCWIQSSERRAYIIGDYNGKGPGYGIGTWFTTPSAYACIARSIRDVGEGKYIHTTGGKSIIDGVWHHVSVICDRDADLVIYVDGVSVATLDIRTKSGSIDNELSLTIGRSSPINAAGGGFIGSIDDVRIYNRALSDKEVKALYDLEKPKGETAEGPSPKYFNKSLRGFK